MRFLNNERKNMADNSVVVITLSSDDDSNTNVESAPSAQNEAKAKKVTARKSTHSKASLSATATKEDPLTKVPKPSTSKVVKNTNNSKTKSTNSAEPKVNPNLKKKTARKSFHNSNSRSAPKVVSTLKNSSNPQCASGSSKNETVTTSLKHPVSNAAIATAKLPGLTITPLSNSHTVVENGKVLPTARKHCNSQSLLKGSVTTNKHFKPSVTSTPKLQTINMRAPNINRTSIPLIPESHDHVKPSSSVATATSNTKVPSSLSISKLAKILPEVSIHPLSKKGSDIKVTSTKSEKSTETPAVPPSLLATLGKTGVTITKSTKTVVNHKVSTSKTATISDKGKKEIKTVNPINAGLINTNTSSNASTVNKTSGSKTSSLIKLLAKDNKKVPVVKENSGTGSSAVKSGVNSKSGVSTKKRQINEKAKLLSTNKATPIKLHNLRNVKGAPKTYSEIEDTSKKRSSNSVQISRLNNILSSLNVKKVVPNSKDIESDSNLTFGSNISKTKTTLNDPPVALKSSNAAPVKPLSVTDYVQSMYGVSTETAPAQVDISKRPDAFSVKVVMPQSSQGSSRKRSLLNDNGNDESANKKLKLGNETRLNGTRVNLATAEDNLKRIAALKQSLKKITAKTSKNIAARKECPKSSDSLIKNLGKDSLIKGLGKECPESSDSQIKAPEKDAKTIDIAIVRGSKNNSTISENLTHKNLSCEPTESQLKSENFTKGVLSERPFKQVTSPKLSLKRKAAEASRIGTKSTIPAIPLPYFYAEPPEKKIKLSSTGQNREAIPLPYTSKELSEEKSELDLTQLNAKAVPLSQSNVDLSALAQQKVTGDNSMPWNSSDNNTTRFKKLLEFSKPFMSATPEEKCTIIKNFHKHLEKADTSFVDSAKFSSLLSDTLKKITASKDTFIHLQTLRTELKAYKRRKNSLPPAKPRRPSNPIEQSEVFASDLEPPLPDTPQKVPAPSLGEHLASALHSITSNLNRKECHSDNNDLFPNIPCSSKQADIVENLRLSMPINNGVKFPSDLIGRPSTEKHANITEDFVPISSTNDLPPMSCEISKDPNPAHVPANPVPSVNPAHLPANPVPLSVNPVHLLANPVPLSVNPAHLPANPVPSSVNSAHLPANPVPLSVNPAHLPAYPVPSSVNPVQSTNPVPSSVNPVHLPANDNAPLVNPLIEGAQKNALFVSLDLQSVKQQQNVCKSKAEVVNGKVENLTPKPVTKQDKETISSGKKSDKIEKRVKHLENYLKKLDKKIKKLQAKELGLDDMDDENSAFLLEDRYKRKFTKVWATLCKIKKRSSDVLAKEIKKHFAYEGSRHDAFNTAIVKLINKRKPFEKVPDFSEVYTLLKDINEESRLALNHSEIYNEAEAIFVDIVRELKRRREVDEMRDGGCYLTDDLRADPAEQEEELKRALERSLEDGEQRMQQLYAEFYAKQLKGITDDEIDCEKAASEDEEAMDHEEPVAEELEIESDGTDGRGSPVVVATPFKEPNSSSLEDNPVAIEVTANTRENTDLPDTDPATPDTDAHEEEEIIPAQPISRTVSTDVIDIGDSASNASTEPETTERRSSFATDLGSRVVRIDDMIEIEEDNQQNSDDSILPSVDELLRASEVN